MTPERQQALIDRINRHRESPRSTDAMPTAMRVPTAVYTDPERLRAERDLLATTPNLVGLSGLLPETNTYATVDVADRSVLLTRDDDGVVSAMLNVCAHRGAEVATGCGAAARLTCPYHGWTYRLDGQLSARRRREYFDGVAEHGLATLPVLERNGLLWVSATPGGSIGDDVLGEVEDELLPFGLESFRLFASAEFERPMNWKQPVETFAETYHLASLHRTSLDPWLFSDNSVFDAMGHHGRMIAVRRSIEELDGTPRSEWDLLPHATILWFIQPNTVFIHQRDHIELIRSNPTADPGTTRLSVGFYVPSDTDEPDDYWDKNFRILMDVTDSEDYATAAGVYRGFSSGAFDSIVIGQNEPALQHFHRGLERLLDASASRST